MEENKNTHFENSNSVNNPVEVSTDEIIVALDVGSTKVIAVAGFLNRNAKVEVLDYAHLYNVGVLQGEIFNLLKTTDTIRHVKEELEMKLGKKIRKVITGISGKHIRTEHISEKLILKDSEDMVDTHHLEQLKKRVKESVNLKEHEDILEIIPQTFRVDDYPEVNDPVGIVGKRLEGKFMVVIGDIKKISLLQKSITDAGLEVEDIRLQPVASAESVLTTEQKEAGVLLVDIGGGTSDLIIVKNNIIRNIGIIAHGGDAVTAEIRSQLDLLPKEAEYIKIKAGSAFAPSIQENDYVEIRLGWMNKVKKIKIKTLAHIIQSKTEQLTSQIDEFIKQYYKNQPGEKLMAGVMLTGGGSAMRHMVQLVTYKLSMDTHHGLPAQYVSSNGKGKELIHYKYSTVLGLLKIGLEKWQHKKESPNYVMEKDGTPLHQDDIMKEVVKSVDTEETGQDLFSQEQETSEDEKKLGSRNLVTKVNDFFTRIFKE